MKKSTLALLFLTLPLAVAAQKTTDTSAKANISRIGEFVLDWKEGVIEFVGPTPSGKLTATLTGGTTPVSLVARENGGEVLKKTSLKSRHRELTGQKIVVGVVNVNVKGKKPLVTGATLARNVTIIVEQISLADEKTSIKVRCDSASYKAGPKLGTGRIDFAGNARIWYYGGLELETTMQSGWIDLGDPDDAENKPPTLNLNGGSTTGTPGKGKR